jgi:hypothetical protein
MATAPDAGATFHAVQRRLASLLPDANWVEASAPLELAAVSLQDPPRLIAASVIEGKSLVAHDVGEDVHAVFAGFLDGTQTSKVVAYAGSIPIVHGTVAAVVRARIDRRLRTWATPSVERRLYAPLRLLPPTWREAIGSAGVPVTDSIEDREPGSPHPFALHDAAIHAVQRDREGVETELAERWCGDAEGALLIDGSISASEVVAASPNVVGVIKSHRTLYAEGDALERVLALQRGERSSVLRITSPRRSPVASWYLRLRDAGGHDPLWGLVRIEIAEPREPTKRGLAERADAVSRWVLAEALPLAVPDARWDKMVYGVRDCEEFLRAIR